MTEAVDAIVVSGAWPGRDSGYGLALLCGAQGYSRVFRTVHFIGPATSTLHPTFVASNIRCYSAPFVRGPLWARFARSMCSLYPAIAIQYRRGLQHVLRLCRHIASDAPVRVVIFEDVPSACLSRELRQQHPDWVQCVRSHNVLTKAFSPLADSAFGLERIAWRVESKRIQRFERRAYSDTDRLWAISHNDAQLIRDTYGVAVQGVAGVGIEASRYRTIASGDPATVVHVGSADIRKGHGLRAFVRECWPRIRCLAPQARLVLAGRGTEYFNDSAAGIEGVGYVTDEASVLSRGRIFVNPQTIGSGVKLKSIIALLAAKALVSTETGIEGIGGTDGVHYRRASCWPEMAAHISELIHNPEVTSELGRSGRSLAAELYSTEASVRAIAELALEATTVRL